MNTSTPGSADLARLGFPPHQRAQAPTQRASGPDLPDCLALILDEIDYGVLLVRDDDEVLYSNHTARRELAGDHPFELIGDRLIAKSQEHARALQRALRAASQQGLRRMVACCRNGRTFTMAVIPMRWGEEAPPNLVMLGRRSVCETLSACGFANCHGLTPAEGAVLAALSAGRPPIGIARSQGVAISTVRTHIASIRIKTGATSIRDLVEQVAQLPPLVSALRH